MGNGAALTRQFSRPTSTLQTGSSGAWGAVFKPSSSYPVTHRTQGLWPTKRSCDGGQPRVNCIIGNQPNLSLGESWSAFICGAFRSAVGAQRVTYAAVGGVC
jgi:hypothetical protein